MRKAFGKRAGITAIIVGLAMLTAIMLVPVAQVFPVMILLVPLMVLQYLYWIRQRGRERSSWQYHRDEPLSATSRYS